MAGSNDGLAELLMRTPQPPSRVEQILAELADIARRKRADYTGKNPDPLYNYRASAKLAGITALQSMFGRLCEKVIRVSSIIENGGRDTGHGGDARRDPQRHRPNRAADARRAGGQEVKQPFILVENNNNEQGNPAGGSVRAPGLIIEWQDGPLGVCTCPLPHTGLHLVECARQEPNGAFVETVIEAALQRIRYYQEGKFACRENALAITKLEEALHWLDHRTRAREARGVEGSHTV